MVHVYIDKDEWKKNTLPCDTMVENPHYRYRYGYTYIIKCASQRFLGGFSV